MPFTVAINAARMLSATPAFLPAGGIVAVSYQVCIHTPQVGTPAVPAATDAHGTAVPAIPASADYKPETWTDVVINGGPFNASFAPTGLPTPADIAGAIRADIATHYAGATLDTVLVNNERL